MAVSSDEVYQRMREKAENDNHRQQIEKTIEELKLLGREFVELEHGEEHPSSCSDSISKLKQSLEYCAAICHRLQQAGSDSSMEELWNTEAYMFQLLSIDRELKNAKENFQLAFTHANYVQTRQLRDHTMRSAQELINTTLHPDLGIYPGGAPCQAKKIQRVEVKEDESQNAMVLTWNDTENTPEMVLRYEIRYDDETNSIIPQSPGKVRIAKNKYAIKLGDPLVRPGCTYTVQVRAVDRGGASQWSDPVVFRLKCGPPHRPPKPKVITTSSTNALIGMKGMSAEGETLTHCIVEHIDIESSGQTGWKSKKFPILSLDVETSYLIENLAPDMAYYFRVKTTNSYGESQVSAKVTGHTEPVIPGPPQNVHISRKRMENMLKLRWKAPTENPEAVAKYVAQIRKVKTTKAVNWKNYATVDHNTLSVIATELKPSTLYSFRVLALTGKGREGGVSTEVQAETKCRRASIIPGVMDASLLALVAGGAWDEKEDSSSVSSGQDD